MITLLIMAAVTVTQVSKEPILRGAEVIGGLDAAWRFVEHTLQLAAAHHIVGLMRHRPQQKPAAVAASLEGDE